MKLKYILLLLSLLFLGSCEDRLELSPAQSIAGEIALSTETNITNILIGTYDEAGQGSTHGGQLQVISDLIGAEDQVTWGGTFLAPAEIRNRIILPDNGFVAGFWNNAYEVINQANLIIDNIGVITSDPATKDRIEGEARFLRALSYFELVQHFSSGTTGVPLRTTGISDYAIDLDLGRATTGEVYDFLINDLTTAIALLPASNDFFADRFSAEALLARVYLFQGDYAKARDAAHNVIENSGSNLTSTFAEAFNNDANSSEDLFAFQVTSQTGTNALVIFYASEGNGGRGGDITINDSYVNSFDSPNDERATFFYESPENGGRLTAKYTNQFGNVPILRLAEMYLIRAEANLEAGTELGQSPLADLNLIRNRAGASELASATKDVVLQERQFELGFEGFFIYDIRRTQGTVAGLSSDDPSLTLPIPQSEIDTNQAIEQNPGY